MIQTSRLSLHRPTDNDIGELIAIGAHPDVERFMDPFGEEEAQLWLARVNRCWEEYGYGRMMIVEKGSGQVIGRSGLQWIADTGETELGWTLRREAWGRGFATEAAWGIADWAFGVRDLKQLVSMIEVGNERSLRLAGRLGMSILRTQQWHDRTYEVHMVKRETFRATHRAGRATAL